MKLRAALALTLFALAAHAASYKSFWVTEVLSGVTVGPVVNKPGNKFDAGGSSWIVLESRRGEINFAKAGTLEVEGPYGLVEQRMFTLGRKGYVFTQVAEYSGNDPERSEAVVSQAVRAPAQKGRHFWSADLPERWVLAPIPSTNPGAHREARPTWSLEAREKAPDIRLFLDMVHGVRYDWKLDGHGGKTKDELGNRRFGVAGSWNGFSGELALISGGGKTDSLVPDGASLSDLCLDAGTGFHLALAYDYSFVIDGQWSASLGLLGSYDTMDAHLSARTMNVGKEDEFSGIRIHDYTDFSKGTSFDDSRLAFTAGIYRDEWYWGLGAGLTLDFLTDAAVGDTVPVLGEEYKIKADRSQPLSFTFSGWYSPSDRWLVEAAISLGSETVVRIGGGVFF